jgi:2-polyprenyl-3-methyl-5-hydroxy-6-metoxy-1,4-benzoquinol methylase
VRPIAATSDEFAERVFNSALGTIEILSIHIGDRLDLYRTIGIEGATASDVARTTGMSERYAREWLEQQTVFGIIDVDLSAEEPVFSLPSAHREVLTDELSQGYLAPLARMLTTAAVSMPRLIDAYLSGGGVSWESFGQDMRESQADMNRPFFDNELTAVFAGLGRVHEILSAEGARVADIGCGAGWSTLALAKAYPNAAFIGFDVDPPSVRMASENAHAAGLADRVSFTTADVSSSETTGSFDVAVAFECIHDMSQPVSVLEGVHQMLEPSGMAIIMDEAVAHHFGDSNDELEKLMYGFSLLVCLPDGMSSQPSEATGTVMRPSTLESYAHRAGFSDISTVGEAGFFRFYQLVP